MKIKKIFLLLIILLLTGCSANYNLTLDDNSKIQEEVIVEIEDTDENFDKVNNIFKMKNISKKNYKVLRDDVNLKITYKNEYNTIEDYILNSDVYKQIFDEIDIEKDLKKTNLSTTANFQKNKLSINNDSNNYIDFLQINIKSELPIIGENSDMSNENIYSWVYNGKSLSKNINISYKNKPNIITLRSIILLIILIIITISLSVIIYRKIKRRQKI